MHRLSPGERFLAFRLSFFPLSPRICVLSSYGFDCCFVLGFGAWDQGGKGARGLDFFEFGCRLRLAKAPIVEERFRKLLLEGSEIDVIVYRKGRYQQTFEFINSPM